MQYYKVSLHSYPDCEDVMEWEFANIIQALTATQGIYWHHCLQDAQAIIRLDRFGPEGFTPLLHLLSKPD
jgi:hypothetical protein